MLWDRNRRDQEAGFTLVELLVVIIIIGILAAIAIPVFLNQRQRANDATLKSDMKSVANAITDADLNATEFRTIFENKAGVNMWGKDAKYQGIVATAMNWNSKVPQVPQVNVSNGTLMAVWIYPTDTPPWNKHEEGDFCLGGVHTNSNYDYAPGTGQGAANYDRYLYYDVLQGGLKTMEELVEAYEVDERSVSCSGHVKLYMQAHGML